MYVHFFKCMFVYMYVQGFIKPSYSSHLVVTSIFHLDLLKFTDSKIFYSKDFAIFYDKTLNPKFSDLT